MTERRLSQLTELRRKVTELERRLEKHEADTEKAVKAILEQIAQLPGARGSLPPPSQAAS